MANEKPTQFTVVQPGALVAGDWLVGVDVSDTTDDAAGSDMIVPAWAVPWVRHNGAQVNISSATPAKVTSLDLPLEAGTFQFEYWVIYQSSATGTGVKFDVNFTGTVTRIPWVQRWVDASATASTAAPDQDAVQAAGHVMGAFASRAKGTAGRGVLLSVDTANADMLTVIEGMLVCSTSGTLELYHGSEGALQTSVMAGSSLIVKRIN